MCGRFSAKCTCVSALFMFNKERHRPTEVSALYERGMSVRCDRENVRTNSGRIYADKGQEMHRQRKLVRCLRELCRCSVRCVKMSELFVRMQILLHTVYNTYT